MEYRWYHGIPPIDVVAEHEAAHPGPPTRRAGSSINLRRINVTGGSHRAGGEDIKVDNPDSYALWMCVHHPDDSFGAYAVLLRLRVVNGEILLPNGFTFWQPLAECRWANRCKYFPVGGDGLPVEFKSEVASGE